ncbi:hypothetical protein BJF91_03730 [Allorhizobium taibaishanense]|uniref:Uncharacterized protein n=2 Tax=Allorhizobium taibaishanense TaxID=887144 RepID=A0A1Q8ZZ23_9HYPH|nr:hypothetical protein BJF91_03730 [Allorhizobium taibaishanense]
MLLRGRNEPMRGSSHPKANLTEADVVAIRESKVGTCELAIRYGVSPSTISEIRRFKKYRDVQRICNAA